MGGEGGVVAAAVLGMEHQHHIQQMGLLLGIAFVRTDHPQEVLRRAAEGAEKAPAGQEKGISRPTAEQGKLIGQAESGEALSSAKRKAWDRAEADDRLLDGLTAQAEEFQQARRADALWRSETFSTGTLPGLLMAEGSRAAMEVEDISRAVQRDARRYDGGFTMF